MKKSTRRLLASSGSTVVECLPQFPKVEGLISPTTAGITGSIKRKKSTRYLLASGSSTVVEHQPHCTKVEGSTPSTTTGTGEGVNGEKNQLDVCWPAAVAQW